MTESTTMLPASVRWEARDDPHPARVASRRSYAAVANGSLEDWLAAYAVDALVEDPVGPSAWDPEGRGHRGHAGMARFWHTAIEPMLGRLEFRVVDSFANPEATPARTSVRSRSACPTEDAPRRTSSWSTGSTRAA